MLVLLRRHCAGTKNKVQSHTCGISYLMTEKSQMIIQCCDKPYSRKQMGQSVLPTLEMENYIWYERGKRELWELHFRQKNCSWRFIALEWSGKLDMAGSEAYGWWDWAYRCGTAKTPTLWEGIVEGLACHWLLCVHLTELVMSTFVPECILGCVRLIVYKILPWTLSLEGAFHLFQGFFLR